MTESSVVIWKILILNACTKQIVKENVRCGSISCQIMYYSLHTLVSFPSPVTRV